MLLVGSTSAVQNIDNVYTSFNLTLNKYKIYEKAYKKCLETYACHQLFQNEATIRNAIHNNIWTNTSTTQEEKEVAEQEFQAAYRQGDTNLMYEYYYHYFMDYYNETNTPELNDYIGVVLPKNAYYGGNFKV